MMNPHVRGLIAAVAFAASVLGDVGSPSRVAASQLPQFFAAVDVVSVYVTVVDRAGRPVRGLTAQDFAVTEDGNPRPIVGFAAVDDGARPERPTVASPRVGAPADRLAISPDRLVIILMDDTSMGVTDRGTYDATVGDPTSTQSHPLVSHDPEIASTVRRIARDVVDGLRPGDRAVVAFTQSREWQDVTDDRAKLVAAIDRYRSRGGSLLSALCGLLPEQDCLIRTLKNIALELPANGPRRNVIVLVAQDHAGFPVLNDDGTVGSTEPIIQGPIVEMYEALHRANVTLYAFDADGIPVTGASMTDLAGLAKSTGGRAFTRTNTPWAGVPVMFEETSTYYILGLTPRPPDKPFQRITVRVGRADVDVRVRDGYFVERSSTR